MMHILPDQDHGDETASPFVLVHGAWHGGWCWARVAPLLEAAGHRVLTPNCMGMAERVGELTADTGLDRFIDDIVDVILAADLHDVVLVGHSFGGCVISGVADRLPSRLAQLVFLDATLLQSGETAIGVLDPEIATARRASAMLSTGGLTMPVPPASAFGIRDEADAAWVEVRLTPHPIKTYEDALILTHPLGNGLPATYIACTEPAFANTRQARDWARTRQDWRYIELATAHDAMVTAPEELAKLLLRIAGKKM